MSYTIDGKPQTHEFNQKIGSVAILLYHKEFNLFMLVRQFRPAIFAVTVANMPENQGKDYKDIDWSSYDSDLGHTIELCAGLLDKEELTPAETACEEISEECGYHVDPEDLIHITTFVVGAHQSGNAQYFYYVEIDESMKISDGGGNVQDGEVITKVFFTKEQALAIARPGKEDHACVNGPPGVLFAFQWWFFILDPTKKGLIAHPPTGYYFAPRSVKTMSNIEFSSDYDKSKYSFNPKRMKFTMDGVTRTWDFALCPNTATCILADMVKKELVFLQKFRPPVLIGKNRIRPENSGKKLEEIDFSKSDPKSAYTLELVVNRVPESEDPRKFIRIGVKQIGYDLPGTEFRLQAKCIPGISQSGDTQYIYVADVSKARVCEKEEDEDIEELRVSFSDLPALYRQHLIGPPTTYYAIGYALDQLLY
uniref:Uridine diphosphate glucose pyrophosphatase NUDT14 n=1 Tax=Caenorhabditis tropicalis TaxID=1561998 RepID=A0A1I7U7U0_9PELO